MITRIILEQFMAHEHSVLELGPGLTVLTGPNNTGKSAVVEALRCVVENPVPKQFIRHGAKEARVEIQTEDGWRVVWVRKDKSPLYELWAPDAEEPTIFAKTGRKVPEEIQAVLKMPQVHLDESNKNIDVHLGNQREPIFLLNQPGSALAQFFAASTESAHLLAMQDLLKDKTQAATRTGKESATRMQRLKEGLDRLAPLPDLELARQKAAIVLDAVRRLETTAPRLENTLQRMRTLRRRTIVLKESLDVAALLRAAPLLVPVENLLRWLALRQMREKARILAARRAERLAGLHAPQALFPVRDLALLAAKMKRGRATASALRRKRRTLDALKPSGDLFPAASLARVLDARQNLDLVLRAATRQSRALEALAKPPDIFPVASLCRTLERGRALHSQTERLRKADACAATLSPPPILVETTKVEHMLEQLRSLRRQRDLLSRGVAARDKELAEHRQRVAERLEELGMCPLCGARLDASHFLQGEHGHG